MMAQVGPEAEGASFGALDQEATLLNDPAPLCFPHGGTEILAVVIGGSAPQNSGQQHPIVQCSIIHLKSIVQCTI